MLLFSNAKAKCVEGNCAFDCNDGYLDKDGVASNGCENSRLGQVPVPASDGDRRPGIAALLIAA
jgi:hypothetical protein